MKLTDLFESADNSDFVSLIKKHCKNNFESVVNGTAAQLYRAMDSDDFDEHSIENLKYITVPPRTDLRSSLTGTNYFLNFTTEHSSWDKIPKRALSASCSGASFASGFNGPVWLIIPFDNVKRFAISNTDFNHFEQNGTNLLTCAEVIAELHNYLRNSKEMVLRFPVLGKSTFKRFSLSELKELSYAIKYAINNIDKNSSMAKLAIKDFSKTFKTDNLWQWLENNLTPENMGIKMYPSLNFETPAKGEVWFEGGYVAIRPGTTATSKIATKNVSKLVSSDLFKSISDSLK